MAAKRRRAPSNPWLHVALNAWSLGAEASSVIALRFLKIGSNGAGAQAEVQRMVSEKVSTYWEIQAKALTGQLGVTPHEAAGKTIGLYRRKVRANSQRLAKPGR